MSKPPPESTSRGVRLRAQLAQPADAASLAFFRAGFGLVIAFEMSRAWTSGRIGADWIEPAFHFTYYGFGWLKPWPGIGMYVHVAVVGIAGAFVAVGLFTRAACAVVFVGFTYLFLLDQATYLNHHYLMCLLAFLLTAVDAGAAGSLDARRRGGARTVPLWQLALLRTQVAVVYVFAGIAKLNPDWLRGEPLRMWLADRGDVPGIGGLLELTYATWFFSYGGLFLDLFIVPALLWRRSRPFAFAAAIAFHTSNKLMFAIGVFPYVMVLATTLFLEESWPRRLARARRGTPASFPGRRADAAPISRALAVALACFVAGQVLVPLRHWLYPGDVAWTEEGHRFAWRMKLRSKRGAGMQIVATDATGSTTFFVDPRDYLTRDQSHEMVGRPDMILQLCLEVAERLAEQGVADPRCYVQAAVSLNGRAPQPLIDPRADLAAQPRSLAHARWITPLREPLPLRRHMRSPFP